MPVFQIRQVDETPYLYAERTCSMDPAEISQSMGAAFQQVFGFMQEHGIAPAGAALSVYSTFDPNSMSFRSGFIIARDDMGKAEGKVKTDVIPAGRVLHFTHKGPYATLRDDYGLMMEYMASEGLEMARPTWEVYMNDPSQVPEDELLTEVYTALV